VEGERSVVHRKGWEAMENQPDKWSCQKGDEYGEIIVEQDIATGKN
jgi:hypothetical protein